MDSSPEPSRRSGPSAPASAPVGRGVSPSRAASSGSSRARATPSSLRSLATSGLTRKVIRPIFSHLGDREASATRRGVDQRRIGAQILRGRTPRSGRRAPSQVDVPSRGAGRDRRVRTGSHGGPTASAKPWGSPPFPLAMATPSRGADPRPRRRAHVPQDLSRRRGAREIGGGRDRPKVRSFTNNDTPVAVTGALARPGPMQAKKGRTSIHTRACPSGQPRGGTPSRGAQLTPTSKREAPATYGGWRPTAGAPRLAHRAGQKQLPRTRETVAELLHAGRVAATSGNWPPPP